MIQSLCLLNLDRRGWAAGRAACVCARAPSRGGAGANGALPPAGNGVGYGRSVRLEAFFLTQNPLVNSNAIKIFL